MQEKIFYNEFSTPYYYSYSPYTKMWYEDINEQIPEPNTQPEELAKFEIISTLGHLGIWEGEESYYDCNNIEEDKEEWEDFEKYIKYICGEKDFFAYDSYSVSLFFKSNEQAKFAHISVHEFIELEEFVRNLSLKAFSSIYIEAFTGVKFFVWHKENNKIRLVIQEYGLGSAGQIDCSELAIAFDVLIDKDEFIEEFLRVIDKYKNLLFEKISKYEQEHNIKFSNPMNIPYINDWLKNN